MRKLLNKILIDTNVLVYMYDNKKDIFEFAKRVIPDAEFFILDEVYKELEKILKEKPNKLQKVKKYLEKLENNNNFERINVEKAILEKYKKVDRLLIFFSNKYIIYTNDKILKEKIKKRNGRVLTLKEFGVYLN